ncbi:hypothetical protein B484DRAFT_321821, partial [Ochromonadaceae sp. CCMP2298]
FSHFFHGGSFPRELVDQINLEVSDHPTLGRHNCTQGSLVCIRDAIQRGKSGFNRDSSFGPATLAFFAYIRSPDFLAFLEVLTNIKGLIPDPAYLGGGVHQTVRGGYLKIHSDANNYSNSRTLHRRVNLFLYLNDHWSPAYLGQLELWSIDLQQCRNIEPLLGRLVVFSCTDHSYHGHQQPLNTPHDRSRRSLALYYYTTSRPAEECFDGDCSRYVVVFSYI